MQSTAAVTVGGRDLPAADVAGVVFGIGGVKGFFTQEFVVYERD